MNDKSKCDKPAARRSRTTIGFQLILSVNLVMSVLVIFFLAYDVRRDFDGRLQEKCVALEDEAKTLLPAVSQLKQHGRDDVQNYIDTVCGQMLEEHSPGHHIVVEFDGQTLQASAHHRASVDLLAAMRIAAKSPARRAPFDATELVVGVQTGDAATVYISETLKSLRRSVTVDAIRRLTGLLVLLGVAGLLVNLVLWRVVTRPLNRLVTTVRQIALGNFGNQMQPLGSRELDYLAREINAMSKSLAKADRDRRFQLDKAREIQQSLLPGDIHATGIDSAHFFQPADEIGGDYFDVLPLQDGSWLFAVADVTGHGLPAALNAMLLKAFLVDASERYSNPGEILGFINQRLCAVCRTDFFVTMFVARCNSEHKELQYASAGHEPGLLLNLSEELTELSATGMVLGIASDNSWSTQSFSTQAGDRLLLATDGVTEAATAEGEMLGRKRLADLFRVSADKEIGQTLREVATAVFEHCGDQPQTDDITMLALAFTAEKRRD